MGDARVDVFFYGLFMDADVLRESQVDAVDARRAFAEGYALRIGRRATLIPFAGKRAYGMVFALTESELERLYTAPGLEQYRPEPLLVQTEDGKTLPVLCYVCPRPQPGEANADYAARLRAVLEKLKFPREYVSSVT
ncbi:MAG TPA: gamma-glutamylcyclotransferase family protein [Steroidobacteraceae bacterium]|nr:gamma-glutamylcyclotransferase family protein [Steroidobacteraceae bacterium]